MEIIMAYSKENLKKVKETLASRRSGAISAYEKRRLDFAAEHPEIIPIEQALSMTGAKIMGAALSHELNDETLARIKAENSSLRHQRAMLLAACGRPSDWLDIKYTCEKCCDTGYVGIDMCECIQARDFLHSLKLNPLRISI